MIRATLAAIVLALPSLAMAEATVTVSNDLRCVASDGLPDHSVGRFPNSGNPNRLSLQKIDFCVTASPEYGGVARPVKTIGIATNGVIIRPGTADWFDPDAPRGFSRDRASGWRLDGMGAGDRLGLDINHAHVDRNGIYHYHAAPEALVELPGSLVGWAADGFEIHYLGDAVTSSYRLRSGTRPTAPGGAFDGTYVQDWEYVAGSGTLDECNGAMVNGTYRYFATNTFPYFPHCLKGRTIMEFGRRRPRS